MPTRAPRVRRGLVVTATALALPLMAACSSQTGAVYTPGVGTNERSADVDVLNGLIVTGEPGTGVFIAGLSNNQEDRADQLVSVQAEGLEVGPGGTPAIPAGGFVNLAESKGLTVSGPKRILDAGKFVLVQLTFTEAGTVNLRVPVVANTGPYEGLAPGDAYDHEGGAEEGEH